MSKHPYKYPCIIKFLPWYKTVIDGQTFIANQLIIRFSRTETRQAIASKFPANATRMLAGNFDAIALSSPFFLEKPRTNGILS